MPEDRFTPLMAEFLHRLAREVENNKALARRLAEPFQAVLLEALQASGERSTDKPVKSRSKGKKYPVPQDFDPYQLFYDEGSPGLYSRLHTLEIDELKGVLSQFTSIPRKDYVYKQNRETLAELAAQGIKNVAARGQAFGDYQL